MKFGHFRCLFMVPWAVLFSLHLIADVQGLEVLRIPNLQGSSEPNKDVADAAITSCPAQAVPKPAGIDFPAWVDLKTGQNLPCFQTYGFDFKMDLALSCLTSPTVGLKESRAIYVIGDSHGAHLLSAFQYASKLPVFWLAWAKGGWDDPIKKLEAPLRQVLSKDDVVVFNELVENDQEQQSYRQQVDALHKITSAVGAKILFIGDTPKWPQDPKICLMKMTPGQESPCATSQELSMSRQLSRKVIQELKASPDVFFFEAIEHYCKQGRCDIFIPGTSAIGFCDFDHMGKAGSAYLAPFLCDFLHRNGLAP